MSKSKLQSISKDENLLALGQANGIIKFYNIDPDVTATLIHEFQPAEHLQAQTTCLKFNTVSIFCFDFCWYVKNIRLFFINLVSAPVR